MLLGLTVQHMLAQGWVVAAQFKTIGIVLAVLHCGVGMCALSATELDDNAVALFAGHDASSTAFSKTLSIVPRKHPNCKHSLYKTTAQKGEVRFMQLHEPFAYELHKSLALSAIL